MDDLISKKELLARYGISYGALYRWKRMGLIPDDWFIKKAMPTGQETFFHRQAICERVELILSRRDGSGTGSLEALARELAPKAAAEPVLIVDSVYGEKRFRVAELRRITAINADGQPRDLTEQILSALTGKDEAG